MIILIIILVSFFSGRAEKSLEIKKIDGKKIEHRINKIKGNHYRTRTEKTIKCLECFNYKEKEERNGNSKKLQY